MCGGGSGLVFFSCAVLGTEYLKAKLGQHPELQFATQKDILRSNRARSIACIAVKPLDTSCRGNKELMSSSHRIRRAWADKKHRGWFQSRSSRSPTARAANEDDDPRPNWGGGSCEVEVGLELRKATPWTNKD